MCKIRHILANWIKNYITLSAKKKYFPLNILQIHIPQDLSYEKYLHNLFQCSINFHERVKQSNRIQVIFYSNKLMKYIYYIVMLSKMTHSVSLKTLVLLKLQKSSSSLLKCTHVVVLFYQVCFRVFKLVYIFILLQTPLYSEKM